MALEEFTDYSIPHTHCPAQLCQNQDICIKHDFNKWIRTSQIGKGNVKSVQRLKQCLISLSFDQDLSRPKSHINKNRFLIKLFKNLIS